MIIYDEYVIDGIGIVRDVHGIDLDFFNIRIIDYGCEDKTCDCVDSG